MSPMRLIQAGQDRASASVANQSAIDALTGAGYANDGSDFAGFARGLSGNGSPRSANAGAGLAAPVGHLYHQLDATDGRGHWLKVGPGNRQWIRVKDQINAGAYVDLVDGATDNTAALELADAAAAAIGVPLYLNPLGAYFLASSWSPAAKWIVPKGAVIKRGATAFITFTGGFEAGDYQVLDNSAGGTGGFWFTPGTLDYFRLRWWGVLGNAYSVDESANWQYCEDQTHDGAEIRMTPGMQILCSYPVRFYRSAKYWNAPPGMADPDTGSVMVKWNGDDTGLIWNTDRAALNTFQGVILQQMNADTAINCEMSTVGFTAGNNTITALGDGYNGVTTPAPWTFKPSDVGKRIFIQASIAGDVGTHTITGFVANPSNGVKGTQVTISPPPDATINFMRFSLGTATFGAGIGINSTNCFRQMQVNQWNIRNSTTVQAVCIARVSGSNNEFHRFERFYVDGIDVVKQYGYAKYSTSAYSASMTAGSNVVTLASAPTGSLALGAGSVGQMFRMGRVGTIADATVTLTAPALAGDTVLHVAPLTQFIPFDGVFTIHSTVTGGDASLRTTAEAPVGATTIAVAPLGGGFNAGDNGADGGHSRANNDGGYGQGQGTITSVLNDHQFTVNFNAPQSVSGLQWLLGCNKGRGILIGPSFNVHHITFDQVTLSGLYRGIVCFGGGMEVEGVININNTDGNVEVGGNNAHPMNLGYINSENSRQHLITSSLQPLEIRGRASGESTSPGKAFFEVRQNAGQAGIDYSNGVCGGFEPLAVTGGSTVWDIRNAGGVAITCRHVSCQDGASQPMDAARVGLDAQVNGYVRCENAFGHQFKIWGMPFTATPRLEIGGLPVFSLYQDGTPRSDLAVAQMTFRRGQDSGIYVDSYMSASVGIVTATIRPRRHVVNTRGYAPDASDTLILCQATQFLDSYVTINGNGNLPVDWECSFKRTDTWAQPFHIFVSVGNTLNGVVENGTGNAAILLNPGDKVRIACTATGVFEQIA